MGVRHSEQRCLLVPLHKTTHELHVHWRPLEEFPPKRNAYRCAGLLQFFAPYIATVAYLEDGYLATPVMDWARFVQLAEPFPVYCPVTCSVHVDCSQ